MTIQGRLELLCDQMTKVVNQMEMMAQLCLSPLNPAPGMDEATYLELMEELKNVKTNVHAIRTNLPQMIINR